MTAPHPASSRPPLGRASSDVRGGRGARLATGDDPGLAGLTAQFGGELLVVAALCLVSGQVGWTLFVGFVLLSGMGRWLLGRVRRGLGIGPTVGLAVVAGLWVGPLGGAFVVAASAFVGLLRPAPGGWAFSGVRRRSR